MLHFKNKKLGFSLFELVLAVAVFSLSSVAISILLIDSNTSTRLSLEKTQALLFAKEGIEAVRSIRDNGWANLTDGDHGLENSGTSWAFNGTSDIINDKYTRIVTITTDIVSTSTKNISVNVQWDLTPSRLANVTLQTILTNWK